MKQNFACLIVDYERSSSELLVASLGYLYPNLSVKGVFDSWKTALPALRDQEYDVLFMDISMPGKTGLELLEMIPEKSAEIIFITAHSEHALNAFKFTPSGYILKPFDDRQLIQAIDKAIERIQYKRLAKQQTGGGASAKIGIPDKKGTEYITIRDILYIEAVNGCTKVVTIDAELTSAYNIGRFKSTLEKNGFFQIHRSFIVNTNSIRRYTIEGSVILSNGMEIPVSKNFKDDFLLIFNKISESDE